ncbi:MAG TPA: hypothetical protein EYP65_05365 [Armatimonadetes bacterium]|nr:hypothetical protein [Armatimonadota bacterium]
MVHMLVLFPMAVEWGISGYTQVRFEAQERGRAQFFIRRNRVKLRVKGGSEAEATIQVALGDKGEVSLKDAFVKWEVKDGIWVKAGQFKWHGSYECLRSASMLALLERSRVVRRFFPGEWDRGLVIGGRLGRGGPFLEVGIWNGNGIKAASEAGIYGDNNDRKDFSLRLSNYPKAKYRGPAPRLFWQLAIWRGWAEDATTGRTVGRRRVGVALQYYFEPAPPGVYKYIEGSSIKFEALWGRGYGLDGVPGRWHDERAFGFYLTATKNLRKRKKPCRNSVALRVDYWKPESTEGKWALSLCLHHYTGEHTKESIVWERPEGGPTTLRAQYQFKF